MKNEQQFKDGIYKSPDAIYYIKNNKIMMLLKGSFFKTGPGFMQGKYVEPLKSGMIEAFDKAYDECKSW